MREIKFRAKSLDQDIMVYFSLYEISNYFPSDDVFYVGNIPFKVGSEQEYTGLKDSVNHDIWEGDIIHEHGDVNRQVILKDLSVCLFKDIKTENIKYWWELRPIEVIGNIYENKGLLETQ